MAESLTTPETAYLIGVVRQHVQRVATSPLLLASDQAFLEEVASRLEALQRRLEGSEVALPSLDDPRPAGRLARRYTRKEAAEIVGVHPNTLINWESRGLVLPQRDWRGWRSYGAEELSAAMALAAHPTGVATRDASALRDDPRTTTSAARERPE